MHHDCGRSRSGYRRADQRRGTRRNAPNTEVEIYERSPELRLQKGYSLGIKGESGIPVLRELDLFDGLRAEAFLTTRFIFCDQRGRTLMRLPSKGEGKNATYRIQRSSLIASLRQAAADVPIHFGAECIGYDGAKVQFADGTSAATDWIVGADGVASVLRSTIVDDDRHYLGLSAIVGDSPAAFDHPLLSGGNFLMVADDGSSVFCYPQHGGMHLSYATHAGEDEIADGADALTILRGRVMGWASPVPEIVAALDPATVVVRGYYDKEPPSMVHHGQLWRSAMPPIRWHLSSGRARTWPWSTGCAWAR